jgi:hypothetical protein
MGRSKSRRCEPELSSLKASSSYRARRCAVGSAQQRGAPFLPRCARPASTGGSARGERARWRQPSRPATMRSEEGDGRPHCMRQAGERRRATATASCGGHSSGLTFGVAVTGSSLTTVGQQSGWRRGPCRDRKLAKGRWNEC